MIELEEDGIVRPDFAHDGLGRYISRCYVAEIIRLNHRSAKALETVGAGRGGREWCTAAEDRSSAMFYLAQTYCHYVGVLSGLRGRVGIVTSPLIFARDAAQQSAAQRADALHVCDCWRPDALHIPPQIQTLVHVLEAVEALRIYSLECVCAGTLDSAVILGRIKKDGRAVLESRRSFSARGDFFVAYLAFGARGILRGESWRGKQANRDKGLLVVSLHRCRDQAGTFVCLGFQVYSIKEGHLNVG